MNRDKISRHFFEENTKLVNRIMVRTLAWCVIVPIALLLVYKAGVFHFEDSLRLTIASVGFGVTIVPFLLYKLKAPDNFLKYYMLVMLGIFIGLLGTNNGIGIYITYILVPIASCMYLDKKFTLRIGIISYIMMAYAVYVNSAGKMEVKYWNWSHWTTYRNYMIGFTLEYIVSMLFLYQIVKRAEGFLKSQQDNLIILEEENDRQKILFDIFDKSISDKRKNSLSSILDDTSYSNGGYAKLVAGHQFALSLQESLLKSVDFTRDAKTILAKVGEYFKLARILYIEPSNEEGRCKLSYQWSELIENEVKDFYPMISDDEYKKYAEIFNEEGYIEIYKSYENLVELINKINFPFTKFDMKILLGSQLWIPIVIGTKYNGIICFDRYEDNEISPVDKYVLSEISSILAAHVTRLNADNANRAKSAFLSSMSHEIRTPMNAILGMTQVALREEMNPRVRKSLNIIKSSADGLLGIINDILDFSKIESGKIDIIPEEYSILSVINDLKVIAAARNLEKGLEIKYSIPKDLPVTLEGDSVRIKQVMVNLLTNAIKYTEEGTVSVNISATKIDDKHVTLYYEVKDTGRGIRQEDIGKLFQSFSQIDQKHNHHVEGTGLGLAISKQLIELMGGNIGVESQFQKGSSFYFAIPQKIIDASPAGDIDDYEYTTEDNLAVECRYPDARVLIVDDNEINLFVAETLFEPFGMKIDTAESARDALEKIRNNEYDLIFMDNFMPDMDGIEATHEIRAMHGNPNQYVPIVALTADAIMGVKEKLIAEGMNDFLAKPIEIKEVTRVLKTFL